MGGGFGCLYSPSAARKTSCLGFVLVGYNLTATLYPRKISRPGFRVTVGTNSLPPSIRPLGPEGSAGRPFRVGGGFGEAGLNEDHLD